MKLDFDSKELRVFDKEEIFKIHPLWIRERSIEKGKLIKILSKDYMILKRLNLIYK